MQKLTIVGLSKDEVVRRTASFNLGQSIYVIDWTTAKPILMSGYILYIGIEHPLQFDNFVYLINRGMLAEEKKLYYENEIYSSKYVAARELAKQMRKHLVTLKAIMNQPYYEHV